MKKNFVFLFILIFCSSFFFAQNSIQIPPIEESFIIKNDDGSDFTGEDLTGDEIIRFALLFGLCDENSLEFKKSIAAYKDLKNYCDSMNIGKMSEEERGEAILNALYSKVLKSYKLKQTKVDVAFDDGTYNCVSSALLYLALAADFNLDARAQETATHVFITVYLSDGRKVDVETTNPYGFNPGSKKIIPQENESSAEKYAVVPKNYYADSKEISDRRAVALVAKNLCSFFNDDDDYVHAVPLGAAYHHFVTKEKDLARLEFDRLTGNFAVYADKKDLSETGLDFLDRIFERYGKTSYLLKQYNDVAYNSAIRTCNKYDFASAKENLEKRMENLTQENISSIRKLIFENQTLYEWQKLGTDDGIKYVQNARKSQYAVSDSSFRKNLENIEESLWSKKIMPLFDSKKYLDAAQICDEGILSIPQSSYLKEMKKVCVQNHAAEIHNQIIPLVNSGKYDEAIEILNEALKENPTGPYLKDDLRIINNLKK